MEWWQAIILGAIQGLTEFLPVSSSGHLVIFQKLFGLPEHDLSFDVIAHLGTLCAIVVVFRSSLLQIFKDLSKDPLARKSSSGSRLFWFAVLGSVPAAIIGLKFKSVFEQWFNSIEAVGIFLLITAAILKLSQIVEKRISAGSNNNFMNINSGLDGINHMNWKKALIIGFSQACAIAPGISRSGSTIATALMLKIPRDTASLFSFALATPAILGATILQLKDLEMTSVDMANLGIGFIFSFGFGLIGLLGLLKLVKKGRLDLFSIYLVIAGVFCLFLL